MKKIICAFLAVLTVLSLSACKDKLKDDEISITIINGSKDTVYGVSLDISVNEEFILKTEAELGKSGVIETDESITIKLSKEDFKNLEAISGFNAIVKLKNEDGEYKQCNNILKFVALYGNPYTYTLTGDFTAGLYLVKYVY